MKQSVMQYLIAQNKPTFAVTQSFDSFTTAMLHLLTLDTEEHDGGRFGFTVNNYIISRHDLPQGIHTEDGFACYQHVFTFGDCMNPHCIYETVDANVKRTFYVAKDTHYVD
jgi:hypothetical protein